MVLFWEYTTALSPATMPFRVVQEMMLDKYGIKEMVRTGIIMARGSADCGTGIQESASKRRLRICAQKISSIFESHGSELVFGSTVNPLKSKSYPYRS